MKLNLRQLKRRIRRLIMPPAAGRLNVSGIKALALGIFTTRPDETGCDGCFERLAAFAEMVLAGQDAARSHPLVQDHLDRCPDCLEEYKALLAALRATA